MSTLGFGATLMGLGSSLFIVSVLSITVVLKRSFIFISGLVLMSSFVSLTIFLTNSDAFIPFSGPVLSKSFIALLYFGCGPCCPSPLALLNFSNGTLFSAPSNLNPSSLADFTISFPFTPRSII